jgi:hypothetical protein
MRPAPSLFLILTLLWSCNDDPDETPLRFRISGVVQKGPFMQGSIVNFQKLNADLTNSDENHSVIMSNNLGDFEFHGKISGGYYEVTATGRYFNENTDEVTSEPIVLKAFVEVNKDTAINVNILTTIAQPRLRYLMETTNLSFSDAREQAETEG